MLTLGRAPCGRNGVDRFVIGKKISNTFLGFMVSKFQIIIQELSTESEKSVVIIAMYSLVTE